MQRKGSISLTPGLPPPQKRRGSIVDKLKSMNPFGGSDSGAAELLSGDKLAISSHIAKTTGKPPSERSDHSATLVQDKLVIIGGRNPGTAAHFADVFVLDLETMVWSEPTLSGEKMKARCLHSATLLSDQKTILVIGGTTGRTQSDDIVYIDTETWNVQITQGGFGYPGDGIAGHAAILIEPDQLFVFGGRYSTTGHASSDVHIFNTARKEWSLMTTDGKSIPRAGHTATLLTSTDGKTYIGVFGGKNTEDNVNQKLAMFDPTTYLWKKLESYGKGPSKPRFFHSTVVHKSVLLFIGGKLESSDEGMHSIYSFDTKTSKWKKIKNLRRISFGPLYGLSATSYKSNVVIFGGCSSKIANNDVHIMSVEEAAEAMDPEDDGNEDPDLP